MGNMTHSEIAVALIDLLAKRGIIANKCDSASGSVYVYVSGSRQKVRIANHGKHRGWFRYNIRTDLKKGREFRITGQRVFLFTSDDIEKLCFRISLDYNKDTIRNASALIKRRKRRTYSDGKKSGREGKRGFCEERTGEENIYK
jgi:hypothetical protein